MSSPARISARVQKPDSRFQIPRWVRGESGSISRAECRNQNQNPEYQGWCVGSPARDFGQPRMQKPENQNPEYQGWCVRSPARELGLSTEPTQNQNPEYLEGLSGCRSKFKCKILFFLQQNSRPQNPESLQNPERRSRVPGAYSLGRCWQTQNRKWQCRSQTA
jgi:hypothetical protein